jgi:hypothetical protein
LKVPGAKPVVRSGGDRNPLEYPKGLSAVEVQVAGGLMAAFSVELAQQLLDELAGRMAADTVRLAPLAYLRGLARRAKAGDFKPELALRVQDARQSRRRVEAALGRAEAAREEALAVARPPKTIRWSDAW